MCLSVYLACNNIFFCKSVYIFRHRKRWKCSLSIMMPTVHFKLNFRSFDVHDHCSLGAHNRIKEPGGAYSSQNRSTKAMNVLYAPNFLFRIFFLTNEMAHKELHVFETLAVTSDTITLTIQCNDEWSECSNARMKVCGTRNRIEREKIFINFNGCRRRIGCRRHIYETAANANRIKSHPFSNNTEIHIWYSALRRR